MDTQKDFQMKKNEEITESNRDTHKDRNRNGQIHLIKEIN